MSSGPDRTPSRKPDFKPWPVWTLAPVVGGITVAVLTLVTLAIARMFEGAAFDWGAYWRGWMTWATVGVNWLLLLLAAFGVAFWVQRRTGKTTGQWLESATQTRAFAFLFMGAILAAVGLGIARGCAGS